MLARKTTDRNCLELWIKFIINRLSKGTVKLTDLRAYSAPCPLPKLLILRSTDDRFRLQNPRIPLNLTVLFGADPAKASDNRTVQDIRKDCLRDLVKIKTAWPGLEYRIERGRQHEKTGVLVLLPSRLAIPTLKVVT